MPRKNLAGTFEGEPFNRWTRMVKGNRWRLLCRGPRPDETPKPFTSYLNLPVGLWTKEGSRDAANAWWELNYSRTQVTDKEGHAAMKAALQLIQQTIDRVPGLSVDTPFTEAIADNRQFLPEPAKSLNRKMLAFWQVEYLTEKRDDQGRSKGRYDNLRRSIDRFVGEIGSQATVDAVTEAKYREFCQGIIRSKLSGSYKRDTISDVRGFIRFLWEHHQIPELRNLRSPSNRAKVKSAPVQHFTVEELRSILRNAEGHLRLFVWLFANCGMRQRDVATLTGAMFDGKYITRKRSKTQDHENSPEVSHVLWPETLKLVEEYRSDRKHSDLMFVQPNGKPWVFDDELNEKGRRSRDDNFAGLWKAFTKEHPQRLPAKHIRGSCANLITGGNQLSLQLKYLAHVPRGVALKFYLDPPQKELDAAIMQLRKTLKLTTRPR